MSGRLDHPRNYEAEQHRKRMLLGVALLAVLLAVIAYFVFRSDGEDSRAEYCGKLKSFNTSLGLEQTLREAKAHQLDAITAVAPRSVTTAWTDASKHVLIKNPTNRDLTTGEAKFLSDVSVIVKDAADQCGMQLAA